MSTMVKARPGVAVSGFLAADESGSEENVPDSNESSEDEDCDEVDEISQVVKNPFE